MENETISYKDVFKFIFLKKHSIAQLCDYYGNPQDVRDHLQLLSDSNRLLAISLKNNIRVLNQMVEEDFRRYQEAYEEYLSQKQIGISRCVDCPFGNGEGGCTIPSCDFPFGELTDS